MFILSNFLSAIAEILGMIFWALQLAIILRVILSWANADPYNGLVRAIGSITEPMLAPFRRLLPSWKMHGWDLSPFLALLTIIFLRQFLVTTLLGIAARL